MKTPASTLARLSAVAAVGALAAALAAGHGFPDAVNEGMRAGSTAVLSAGAAASYAGIAPVEPRL